MDYKLVITVDDTTRDEACDQTICLKDNIASHGEKLVAAGLLGVSENDIKNVLCEGGCEGCNFHKFIRTKES